MSEDGETHKDNSSQGYDDADIWAEYTGRAGEPLPGSTMYRMRLNGPAPEALLSSPKDMRPARPVRGERILKGHWRFGRYELKVPEGHAPWGPPFPALHFADRIHRFHWLRDVFACGEHGVKRARSLTLSWVNTFGRWDSFGWRLDATADRIINWLSLAPDLIATLDPGPKEALLDSLARQVRHLALSDLALATQEGRFRIAVALTLSGLCLPDGEKYLEQGLSLLETETDQQVLADGGHVSRSPSRLAETLIDLHITEDLLLRMGRAAPDFMSKLQTRMQSMLKFLTPADDGLLVANGGSDGIHGLGRAALSAFGEGGGKFAFAQLSGYHRVVADDLTVYMDTGAAPPEPYADIAHAACLSISIQDGPERLVTSMGAHVDLDPEWRFAARQTPAHSTLILDDENSGVFKLDEDTGQVLLSGPTEVSARRMEENDQFLLTGQHSGWRASHGFVHRRRLYVDKSGTRVTGEDSVSRPLSEITPPPEHKTPFAVRFHLHPDVKIARGDDDKTVFLGLERRERVWRFRSDMKVDIEDSVYAAGGVRRSAKQLVVSSEAEPESDGGSAPNLVRWVFTRVQPAAEKGM